LIEIHDSEVEAKEKSISPIDVSKPNVIIDPGSLDENNQESVKEKVNGSL